MNETGKTVDKENFASRWSRRKQQLKREQHNDDESARLPDEEEGGVDEAAHDSTIEQISAEQARSEQLAALNALSDEDMPDIATLTEDSDFSGFMSRNVSEGLRQLALQKLFHGKSFNIRDGLDEYDGDYTQFEKLDPSTITADIRHRMEVEAEKLKAELETTLDSPLPEEDAERPDEVTDDQGAAREAETATEGQENFGGHPLEPATGTPDQKYQTKTETEIEETDA